MAQQDRMFDIPGFTYFSSGNDYTGGCHGFRYKLYLKDDLHAAWWEDDLCFEKCTIREEETFPADADGLTAAIAWLRERAPF
ncbi:MAG: hypothetical protein DBX66_07785 [Clostridiales bacterium]|uniref:Uncharacterized protein n=1 Tax=Harryflintia acetispora TaxID=1849041 RepID=A0A9X8Y8N7_9FIRM|nr:MULTISPECIES: hypothetical protein [Oscillospiraceae]PWM35888.1 MAG: hypothetical protein DBX66_07785 [Clostridiales bacterium]RGB66325.1 hypothetical protein DW086_09105 [Harryflintia acetispora]TCL44125.1 hypothetical protein EDD78_103163 [Harryflintia acetispora]